MSKSDENNAALMKSTSLPGGPAMGERKFGREIRHNRRALSEINQNLPGGPPNPCALNKRSFQENNVICEKSFHRPITRKFAALQMGSGQQHCPEESKRFKPSVPSLGEVRDGAFVYVDEENRSKDHPIPMFLEQATEVEDETGHQMEEVEMEDIFEEVILDIDSCDAKDSLAVVEYLDDIYACYKKMEISSCVPPDYMVQQFDINERMRSILIDWLIEVHHKFELRDETLFLTIHLIDRFLAKQMVVRKKLQLVGLIAMLLACKYEEVSVPIVEDLVYISDKAYTRKEVLDMEKLMLNTLQFNLSLPTPYVFMRRFLKAAQSDKKLEHLSFYLIELSLVEYEMLKFPPSMLAAAAIYTAHCALYKFSQWNKTCEFHTNYSQDQLLECSRLIVSIHRKAGTGRLTGTYRKYCTSKFGFTARCEPAEFVLETQ